jgi:hypothetical protein
MADKLKGRGRVTIFPFLHDWESGSHCVLAYATTEGGDTAVLGVLPVEGNVHEPGDLFAMAGRHSPGRVGEWRGSPEAQRGAFLACIGWSARGVRKPGTIDVPDAGWALDMTQRVRLVGKDDGSLYGHLEILAGRMVLDDLELAEQARALIKLPVLT